MPFGFFWKNGLNSFESVRRVTPCRFAIVSLLSTPVSHATRRSLSCLMRVSSRLTTLVFLQVVQKYRSRPVFVTPCRRIRRPHTSHILLWFCMKTDNSMSVFWSRQAKELDDI